MQTQAHSTAPRWHDPHPLQLSAEAADDLDYQPEGAEENLPEPEGEGSEEEEGEEGSNFVEGFQMIVKVAKGDKELKFNCFASTHFVVDSVSYVWRSSCSLPCACASLMSTVSCCCCAALLRAAPRMTTPSLDRTATQMNCKCVAVALLPVLALLVLTCLCAWAVSQLPRPGL